MMVYDDNDDDRQEDDDVTYNSLWVPGITTPASRVNVIAPNEPAI